MKQMRKSSRQRSEQWALEVFDHAPFITLSMTHADGSPYAVPLSIIRASESVFYFHCASEGEKIDCITANPTVCLTAVSKCTPAFEAEKNNFTMHYRSAIAMGKATIVADKDEKIEALRLICERFLPKFMDHFNEAIARSLAITTIVRIDLTEPAVGKEKS